MQLHSGVITSESARWVSPIFTRTSEGKACAIEMLNAPGAPFLEAEAVKKISRDCNRWVAISLASCSWYRCWSCMELSERQITRPQTHSKAAAPWSGTLQRRLQRHQQPNSKAQTAHPAAAPCSGWQQHPQAAPSTGTLQRRPACPLQSAHQAAPWQGQLQC